MNRNVFSIKTWYWNHIFEFKEKRLRKTALNTSARNEEPEDFAPLFILGAPRSGTTFTGRILNIHPDILYLNEPRWFWGKIYPPSDSDGFVNNPSIARIRLDCRDADSQTIKAVRAGFYYLLLKSKKKILVEKTPDNCARIEFLNAIFPFCRFIHIIRDPHDTAISLQKALSKWFPSGWKGTPQYYVWDRYFSTFEELSALWKDTTNDYERGLLIWRALNDEVITLFQILETKRYIQIRYEDLVKNTKLIMNKIYNFIHVEVDKETLDASEQLSNSSSINRSGRNSKIIRKYLGDQS